MSNQTSQGIILLLGVVGDMLVYWMLRGVLTGILCSGSQRARQQQNSKSSEVGWL